MEQPTEQPGGAPRALTYRPWVAGPFRWRLGLRPLDPAAWLERGPDHDQQIAAKAGVLARHHDTAVAVIDPDRDGALPESAEVLDAVVDHLAVTTGSRPRPDRALHPIDAAGRLVAEDLVVMVERGGRLVVGAGSVCFPNRWDLRSRIGRTMAEVHAPVPRLGEQLGAPIDALLARLRPDRGYWRLGWGVVDTDELHLPPGPPGPSGPSGPSTPPDPARLVVRVERETLRRLPRTGCVLFTIRTHLAPLAAVLERPDVAAALAEAVEAVPADVARYKQLDVFGPALIAAVRDAPDDVGEKDFVSTRTEALPCPPSHGRDG